MRYVIIGNGVAGTTAAARVRDRDASGEILIVSDETHPFYSRIRLVDYLAGETQEGDLIIRKEGWYEDKGITLRLGCEVREIVPLTKSIILADGRGEAYDKLLVATGSTPFMPPLEGSEKKGVFTLKTIEDARLINEYLSDKEEVIVLGGGVLGIEAGNSLRKRGKRVAIVEFFPRLLPRQMDAEGSEILKATLERMGLTFHLGTTAKEVVGGNRVEGLLLQDGRLIRADSLLVSAGIRPRTTLLGSCGIKLGKGVPVDDRMETEIPDIYAAGDLIEHRGVFYGIWSAAEKQGEVAGIDMAGGDATYEGTIPSNILKVAGVDLFSAGDIDAEGRMDCMVIKDPEKGVYRKLVVKNGRLAGCILCGDVKGRSEILSALREHTPVEELKETIPELNAGRDRG